MYCSSAKRNNELLNMPLLKVKDNHSLVRESSSGALINRDVNALREYEEKRRLASSQRQELNNVKIEIDSIKNDLCDIKELMYKLLDKNSHG